MGCFWTTFALMKRTLLAGILGLLLSFNASAQNEPVELVQFSGVVLSGDSLSQVPYASIMIANKARGTISDYYGFFSFVARPNDTIQFSAVGFKPVEYIIPDTLTVSRYSIIQVLNADTIELPTALIYPWPSREQFKKAFLDAKPQEDDYARAQRNLAREWIGDDADLIGMDSQGNYSAAIGAYNTRLYSAGFLRSANLIDPLAWSKFVQAWRRGDFKRKKKQ